MTRLRLAVRNRWRLVLVLAVAVMAAAAMQVVTYANLATGADRAVFAEQSEALARQVMFLAAPPEDLGTLGGYITWRVYGSFALLLSLWAVWCAAAATRGDERDGIVEQELAAGMSRARVLAQAFGIFLAFAFVATAGLSAGVLWPVPAEPALSAGAVALQGLAFLALLCTMFAMAVVVAQFTRSVRGTFAVGGVTAFAANLVYVMGNAVPVFDLVRPFSPFTLFGSSQPLVAAGAFSPRSVLTSVVWATGLLGVAVLLFGRRDLAEPLFPGRVARARLSRPQHVRWFSVPVVAELFECRLGLVVWSATALVVVSFFTLVVPSIVESLQGITALQSYLQALADDVERGIVGLFLLGTLQLLLAALALWFVAQWTRSEWSGRLAIELSTPVTRTQIVWRRIAAVTIAGLMIAAGSTTLLVVLGRARGLDLGVAGGLRTVVALVVFMLAFAAAGSVLTALAPRGALLGLGVFTAVSYFIKEVAPLYALPPWALNLSVFHLVGNPLVEPLDGARMGGLAVVTAVGFAIAIILAGRRDLVA